MTISAIRVPGPFVARHKATSRYPTRFLPKPIIDANRHRLTRSVAEQRPDPPHRLRTGARPGVTEAGWSRRKTTDSSRHYFIQRNEP